jgi:hypothetical protein
VKGVILAETAGSYQKAALPRHPKCGHASTPHFDQRRLACGSEKAPVYYHDRTLEKRFPPSFSAFSGLKEVD